METLDLRGLSPFDPEEQAAYDSALERAQGGRFDNLLKRTRFYVRQQVAAQAIGRAPELDIAECGCWFGHSSLMLAETAQGFGGRFSIFDSFEGLSEFRAEDRDGSIAPPSEEDGRRVWFASDEAHVRNLLSPFPFVDIYRGWIPERFAEVADRRFSFVHLDVDLYEPTRDGLAFFWPRVAPGGAVFVDDCGYKDFPGAKRAVDEFLRREPPSFFMQLPTGGAFLLK